MFKLKCQNLNGRKDDKKSFLRNLKIARARRYLKKHTVQSLYGPKKHFRYLKMVEKGNFKRYYFYEGCDTRIIFIVLSAKERKEIIRKFKEKIEKCKVNSNEFSYKDSITGIMAGNEVHHRFYRPNEYNTSITFMDDNGEVWGGNFPMDFDEI